MATNLKPLGDRVIVKPKAKEEMTKSGIVLPDTASEKPQEGSVLAVGPGRVLDNGKRVEMEVKTGDKRAVRQVRRHRGQARRRGVPRHPRKRPARDRHQRLRS